MTNNVLVSIAMTCYNQGHFIRDAIKSIVSQTYKNWQLVIVNDFSTDNSTTIIHRCIKEFNIIDKVRLLDNSFNRGYGQSLNKAIRNSDGELIAIIDSDDSLATNSALEICVNKHIENPDIVLTYSNYNECNRKLIPKTVFTTRQIEDDESYLEPKSKVRVSHLKVFKKKYFDMTEGIDPDLKQTVDKDLVLKLEEQGKFLFINKVLYNYRKHGDNLSRSIHKKSKEYQKFVADMRNKIFENARKRRGIK